MELKLWMRGIPNHSSRSLSPSKIHLQPRRTTIGVPSLGAPQYGLW